MSGKGYCFIRPQAPYPREEALAGLKAAGYTLDSNVTYEPGNVLITWNDYGSNAKIADRMLGEGGYHLIMENGYMQREQGYFIVTRTGFCGEETPVLKDLPSDRFEELGLEIEPWRSGGEKILVCGQRGGNYNRFAMANSWPQKILWALRSYTDRSLLYRPHPERARMPLEMPDNCEVLQADAPLEELLEEEDLHAVVVWTSNAATMALLKGIPVIYEGPSIACAPLATQGIESIENPVRPMREQFFYDLAWRQFNREEIRSGYAFSTVLAM